MFDVVVACLVLTALFAYVNHQYVRLPPTIGVMVIALLLSLALIGLDALGVGALHSHAVKLLKSVDFSGVLMQGMLSLLLFAGALPVDLDELRSQRWPVGVLAVFGTVGSTVIVGFTMYYLLPWVGSGLDLTYCLLFGALISPTDPIAVMGILKSAGAPKDLEITIAGESLFNDGVGVVLFALLLEIVAGGGIVFGLVLGYVTYRMLKSIDEYQVEILLTLAAVMGGYALANRLHVSGPLAMVVGGLMIGNQGRALAMSDTTRDHLDMFWELLDQILNSALFVLRGLQITLIHFAPNTVLAVVLVILVTLGARLISVGVPLLALRAVINLPRGGWKILVWGGLRGGISVALALSLPAGPARDLILTLTYCVVVFSIVGQGSSMRAFTRRVLKAAA